MQSRLAYCRLGWVQPFETVRTCGYTITLGHCRDSDGDQSERTTVLSDEGVWDGINARHLRRWRVARYKSVNMKIERSRKGRRLWGRAHSAAAATTAPSPPRRR